MSRPLAPARAGFTVVELLCVISIIAVLASMLLPTIGKTIERANNVKCQSNLRQIGVAAHAAATDHDNTYPIIEFDPENPAYAEASQGAKPLPEALAPYGIGPANLQCPEDLKGPNWFAKLGCSYLWSAVAEGESVSSPVGYFRRRAVAIAPSRLRLATDYEAVHLPDETGARKRMNALYADGHVVAR